MNAIRMPAVAGSFYPEEPDVLERDVQALLGGAQPQAVDAPVPKALIVPHAGYIYSGPIAANAYARLASARGRIKRVVLLGPAHRVAMAGLALPGVDGMQTPLGIVPIDAQAVAQIASLPQVVTSAEAHAREHALEVHLPFLQQVLGSFALLPLVVGRAATEQVAEVIERLWGGDETLIVISSDLSHYLTYSQARSTDRETAHMILLRPCSTQSSPGLRRDAGQRTAERRAASTPAAQVVRSAQFGRHRRRSQPRGRLCIHRVFRTPDAAGERMMRCPRPTPAATSYCRLRVPPSATSSAWCCPRMNRLRSCASRAQPS